jgi:arylsulfatase A
MTILNLWRNHRIVPLLLILAGIGDLAAAEKPNVIVIFCDDLGYGDLSCYGHPTIKTPNLDRLAAEGQKWTNFYAAASVCTPSRAGLMTGRLPIRSGMCSSKRRVLFPDSAGGLPANEITMARALKTAGYTTACVGKWHLGHLEPFLPTNRGFDSYFGIPYSNDMDRLQSAPKGRSAFLEPRKEYWNVPLMRNREVIERPAMQESITKRYAEEAVSFIKGNKAGPFFLYLAHSMPHVPLFRSKEFEGVSTAGLYGDVIEEIDWSVGQIVSTLRSEGIAEKTLVVFTSDNGPWLVFDTHGGSAGHLRGGKGSTWEGGMREPAIFWWPGKIEPGIVHGLGSTLDLFPTACSLAGAKLPDDRTYDGVDLSAALLKGTKSPRDEMFYYWGSELWAVRKGDYKLHYVTKTEYVRQQPVRHDPPLLFHLGHDPSEKFDVAKKEPDVLNALKKLAVSHTASFPPPPSVLETRIKN